MNENLPIIRTVHRTASAPRTSECFTALKPEGPPKQDLYPSQIPKKPLHFLASVSLLCCSFTLCNSQLPTNGHHPSNIHDGAQDPSQLHQSKEPEMLLGLTALRAPCLCAWMGTEWR